MKSTVQMLLFTYCVRHVVKQVRQLLETCCKGMYSLLLYTYLFGL